MDYKVKVVWVVNVYVENIYCFVNMVDEWIVLKRRCLNEIFIFKILKV